MKTRHSINTPVARAVAFALAVAASSQAVAQSALPADTLEEVVVTGIRRSLTSSMNLKRDAQGVVDGIVAEDIGKFPDTNLAESLQRISGVSIDRTSSGEGQHITVRGVGPDFNLVLLNGRQMPASSVGGTPSSRAFDFANLASESIAAVEVYKTSRASLATGGIGATVNIKTARPLENPGFRAEIGAKGVDDRSAANEPNSIKRKSITPEVSGIYSDTFADNTFGIAITGSYQDRTAGFNQAAVPGGWRTFHGNEVNWGTIPAAGSPDVTNHPGPNDIYSVPQNMNYSVNSIERKRTNGQLTLQYKPVEAVTATLDYTYSENKVSTLRNELSAWFNFGPSVSSWTNGPVAGPLIYSETIPGNNSDVAMAGSNFATKNENNSVGFNLKWDVNDRLGLELDAHNSTATSGADSPYGSSNSLGTAGFFRGTTTVDFSHDFPVLSIALPPSLNGNIAASQMLATGSTFQNSYQKNEITQAQLKGDWKFDDNSRLDFGVSLTDVKNRSAFSNVQNNDNWGGLGTPADYPDSAFTLNAVRPYFNNIDGSNNSALFNQFFTWDFNAIRNAAAVAKGNAALYLPSSTFDTDRSTEEKSHSAFVQYGSAFDIGRPAHVSAGLRYEKTDVTSKALVPIMTGNVWTSANEFAITKGAPGFTTLKGDYKYVLPSFDFDVELASNLKLRASWGKTIGRPTWDQIQGGQTLDTLARINGGTGSQGNPGLKPLESKNIDLSLEWYYDKASYLSVGFFHKAIDNYIGISQIDSTPFNLPNPGAGPWVTEANTAGACAGDVTCIRNYIFKNHASDPAVTVAGLDVNGNTTGSIAGRPGIDPVTNFRITVPANQKSAALKGAEVALQQMFGDTGFGAGANFTWVKSDLSYDVASIGEQFALEGLSNSANFVGFYEKHGWEVRAAYNWRDKFLSGRFDGAGPSPVFTAPYGQIDVNVGYQWTESLSFQAEVINLANKYQRLYGRTRNEVEYVTQTGARYMIGARYKFGK